MRLDARPRTVSAGGVGANEGTDIMLICISPNKSADDKPWVLYGEEDIPAGCKYVCVQNDKGYIAEFAIPVSYLNKKYGSAWQDYRLNICVDDTDDDGYAQLWWMPSWRDKENNVGSGLFIKQ